MFDVNELGRVREVLHASIDEIEGMEIISEYCYESGSCEDLCTGTCAVSCTGLCAFQCIGGCADECGD